MKNILTGFILFVLWTGYTLAEEPQGSQLPECKAGQLYEWDDSAAKWRCLDDPRGAPGTLAIDLRLRIRAAQRSFESARYEAAQAFNRLQQTTPGIEWLNKEKELRDKARFLSDLEAAAREICESTTGLVYVTDAAQCEPPQNPAAVRPLSPVPAETKSIGESQ